MSSALRASFLAAGRLDPQWSLLGHPAAV